MGRTLAARVGVPVGRGWGAVSVVRSGVLTAAGKAPGARQGRGEPGRRGAGVGSWRGWGRASQLCSRRWPLRLEMPRERTLGGVNPGFAGRDSDGCGWAKMFGFLLFHLALDVEHTWICLLQFDNSTL